MKKKTDYTTKSKEHMKPACPENVSDADDSKAYVIPTCPEKTECERLVLRPLSLMEMERIQNGNQDFLEKSVLTQVIMSAVIHKIEQMHMVQPKIHPWLNYWLISEKGSGRGVGLIGSKNLPDAEGYVEIGYAMAREYRCRGYMTEALLGFLDWLCEYPFCSGAKLLIRSANVSSIRVAENCGFEYEGMQDIYRVYRYLF